MTKIIFDSISNIQFLSSLVLAGGGRILDGFGMLLEATHVVTESKYFSLVKVARLVSFGGGGRRLWL